MILWLYFIVYYLQYHFSEVSNMVILGVYQPRAQILPFKKIYFLNKETAKKAVSNVRMPL